MNTISLQDGLHELCEKRRIVSGLAFAYGDGNHAVSDVCGLAQETTLENGTFVPAIRPLVMASLFDLASVTKLFTSLAILQLSEKGALRLDDPIGRFDARFCYIADLSIRDLLSFRAALRTDERIDTQQNREAALAQLFSIKSAPEPLMRYYSDMGAMVLKYVIEAAAGMPLFDYIRQHILAPLGMSDTYSRIPDGAHARAVCYNYERRILNGAYDLDTGCTAGVVHDPKARILRADGDDLCGHAGLFSTIEDMIRLAQGLLNDRLLARSTLLEIGKNRTGRRLPDGTHTQYLGYLCFAKHPDQTYSEVPACFGDQTIALNGFTGNHFSVDPNRGQFIIILANKIHNRVTLANGRADPFDPTQWVTWNDGRKYPVSQNYTFLKDRYLKEPIGELLGDIRRNH
ncbi:MAG: serine hydrolase domain-containing protein [Clostridia bacterium]